VVGDVRQGLEHGLRSYPAESRDPSERFNT
jgi:hypothetical protein